MRFFARCVVAASAVVGGSVEFGRDGWRGVLRVVFAGELEAG